MGAEYDLLLTGDQSKFVRYLTTHPKALMPELMSDRCPHYTSLGIAAFFALGGLVTGIFSSSLAVLAVNATPLEALAVGLVVPSFTWVV